MTPIEKFHAEYIVLANKHNLDFFSYVDCSNKLLTLIIKLFGKRAKLVSRMTIKELEKKDITVLEEKIKELENIIKEKK